ncbi:Protein ssh4 [Dispira simplex]|nr:Protein ssh4 [Dispira simplex]
MAQAASSGESIDLDEVILVLVAILSALFFLGAVLFAIFLPRLPRWLTYLVCCCHCYCCPSPIRRCFRAMIDDSYAYGGYYGESEGDGEFYVSDELRQSLFQNDAFRQSYELGRAFEAAHPYGSVPTALTPEQHQMIMEKGVAAWQFVLSSEINCMPQMDDRTELIFYGGENCVQTNLPLPKQNPVYYFEVKLQEKPQETNVALGLATKPYPSWRLTGWNKHSVGYHTDNGRVYHNNPFRGVNLGHQCFEGDVIGVGYQPRSGTVFFTRNGRRYKSVTSGMLYDLFPTVSADGYCVLSTNFGQRGFVFIEANVKRWGLAPLEGTQCPPPMYGHDQDTFLVETSSSQHQDPGASWSGQAAMLDPSSSTTTGHRPAPLLDAAHYYNHHHQNAMEREAQAFAQYQQTSPNSALYRTDSLHELPENPHHNHTAAHGLISPARPPTVTFELPNAPSSASGQPNAHHSESLEQPSSSITIKGNNVATFVVNVPRFRSDGPTRTPSHIDFALPLAPPPAYTEEDPHPDATGFEITFDDIFGQAQEGIAEALVPNPRFEPVLPSPPAYPQETLSSSFTSDSSPELNSRHGSPPS